MTLALKKLCFKGCCTLALCLLLISFSGKSQQLVLKNYKVKDGLPSCEIYCAFQDSRGFIWFGSDGGVSRFDGYSFKNYTTEDGLADNVVFGISEDRHGRIWFRSLTGKLCYTQNDSIYRIGANEIIFKLMKNGIMTSFYIDSGDTLWCGLRACNGFFKILPGYDSSDFHYLKIENGPYLIEIENGHLISGTCGGTTTKFQPFPFFSRYKKQAFIKKIDIPDLDPTHIFYSKLCDDTFLIADKEKLFSVQQNSLHSLLRKEQIFNTETILLKISGNYAWLGLFGKGVLRTDKSDYLSWKKTTHILDGFSVSDVLTDEEGGTWFTTLDNGIYYSSPARFIAYQQYTGFSKQKNYNIEKIGKDHILVSNEPDKVDIVSPGEVVRNVSVNYPQVIQLLERSGVSTALIITGNTLIQNSYIAYLWLKDEHRLKKIHHLKKGACLVYFFAQDSTTKRNYLLDRYKILTLDKNEEYVKPLDVLPSRTFSFYMDKKGILWLGCLNGLWSFENNEFNYHGNENKFLKSAIEDIKESADGTRYYATRGNGIIIYKDGKYSKITTANGLASNNCKCLYIDKDSTIWVGSKNGICKLKNSADGLQVLKFDLTDNEFSYEVFKIEKTQNTLWLFTNKGLLSYELNTSKKEFPPRLYITQFSVNEISHLKDSIRAFSYDENYLRISYIGLSFQSLGKLYYTYKLDGLDTTWRTTQSTSLQYPFLPPGNYKFFVKAVSFGGTESKYQASISFTIHKPFWKTIWFITAISALAITATWFLFYFRLKRIKKKEEEKTIFNKQLAELEMKSLRSQMNPHFIFNAINSIQNYIVKNDSRTAQDYLAKFARLIRNVLENSKKETISLATETETLKLYIELEQLRAPGKFTFSLVLQPGLQTDTILIPPLIIQPYAENAILHGLMPLAGTKGELKLSLEKKENKLICTIDDNGVGRKKAAELKQKKQLLHSSIGLSVTEDRIKMTNSLQKTASSITVEDKIGKDGEALGTRIIIVINLEK